MQKEYKLPHLQINPMQKEYKLPHLETRHELGAGNHTVQDTILLRKELHVQLLKLTLVLLEIIRNHKRFLSLL